MHESMARLYDVLLEKKEIDGHGRQKSLAYFLNEQNAQTINNWEKRGISQQGALMAQNVFGVSAQWILNGSGKKYLLEKTEVSVSSVTISHFDAAASMGKGLVLRNESGIITNIKVSRDWISGNLKNYTRLANLCIVTGFGDSMFPKFNSGDPLLVDLGVKTVDFDSIYFFRIEHEGFIKRLQRVPGDGIRVLSENKGYESWIIKSYMDFEVYGRVLKVWRSEDV